MRIISGTQRGKPLQAPAGDKTRPTPSRVREATLNALNSLNAVRNATVLDLFAGTGALGIEALSRGAAHATFVENNPAAIKAIETNLAKTDFTGKSEVLPLDAHVALSVFARNNRQFDLALVDPPYDFSSWDELLESLPTTVAAIESDHEIAVPTRWDTLRAKRYGSTWVTVIKAGNIKATER